MEPVLALLAGLLAACGVYLMLARHLLRLVFGVVLIGSAANLVVFVGGGLTEGAAPLIPDGRDAPEGPVANPLPQALVLTAIVIGFGIATFMLALARAAYRRLGTVDPEAMRVAEPVPAEGTPSGASTAAPTGAVAAAPAEGAR
ncbi:MAG: NADH-quinone oxidoreductase subunit K [Paracoccaceae bacterium]